MHPPRHDPIQRLNEHHCDDLLAVARAFGGAPTATSARAVRVDCRGIDLEIVGNEGTATTRVELPEPVDVTTQSVRGALHRLATHAKAILANSDEAGRAHE